MLVILTFLFQVIYLLNNEKRFDQGSTTLDSGINIGVRLLVFGLFSGATFLIRESNAYFFSKYPLFYGMGGCLF